MAWHKKGLPQREKDIISANTISQLINLGLIKPDRKEEAMLVLMKTLKAAWGMTTPAKK